MTKEALLPGQSTPTSLNLPQTTQRGAVFNRAVDFYYQALKQRWVLLLAATIVVGFLLAARGLPQLPGQLSSDPTASARWFLETSSKYGTLGGLLDMLGLFNALHSPLLQLALAILILGLAIYLSDSLVIAWRFYRLPTLLAQTTDALGAPVAGKLPMTTYRARQAVAVLPEQLAEQLPTFLHDKFPRWQEAKLSPTAVAAAEETSFSSDESDNQPEWRLLATRDTLWLYLRPVSLLGLLLGLGAIWWVVIVGWNITPPLLAPGDSYRYAQKNLELRYLAPTSAIVPELWVKRNDATVQQQIEQATTLGLGSVGISAQAGPPALLLRTRQAEATLERVGQPKVATLLGLVFPSINHEESILLRKQGVGLRIVRTAAATANDLSGFLVELVRVQDAKPLQVSLNAAQHQSIPLDRQVALELTVLPSLEVSVNYWPGRWLLWLAPLLCLIGAPGFLRRPAYLLIQVGPWPDLRSVVIAQSNLSAEIERLQSFFNTRD